MTVTKNATVIATQAEQTTCDKINVDRLTFRLFRCTVIFCPVNKDLDAMKFGYRSSRRQEISPPTNSARWFLGGELVRGEIPWWRDDRIPEIPMCCE